MGLINVPILLISTSTVSPAFIQTGGFLAAPTPPVVPVIITSPGSSSVNVEIYAINFGTLNTKSLIGAYCITVPLSLVSICNSDGSFISSLETIQGPKPPVPVKFFRAVN